MNTELKEYNKFQKVINIFQKYGVIIISIIIGIIGILSIFITAYFNSKYFEPGENTAFKYSIGILEIIGVIICVLAIAILYKKVLKKIPSKILLFILLAVDMVIFIYWINAIRIMPLADQQSINDMAVDFLKGNISSYLEPSKYLFLYPFQFGITFLVAIIYKIFGANFLNIYYMNAICSVVNLVLLFYITKRIFKNENIQKILVILLGGFSLYWMFFNPYLYGNICGLTLALIAVLFTIIYLDNSKIYNLIFAGVFISLSILIKSNYNIFLCGILIVLVLDIIKKWKLKIFAIVPTLFLIGYLFVNLGYNAVIQYKYNIHLPKGIPMITYVYMGMAETQTRTSGWYTGEILKTYEKNNYDNNETSKETQESIKNRIKYFYNNPKEFMKYYYEKIGSTWLNPTFQTVWVSSPSIRYELFPDYAEYLSYHKKALNLLGGELYNIEEGMFNIYEIIIFVFAAIGIFSTSKELDLKKSLLPIIFLGGFLFHIIWETKAIYVIQYYYILLPFGAYGINYVVDKIKKIIDNKNLTHLCN